MTETRPPTYKKEPSATVPALIAACLVALSFTVLSVGLVYYVQALRGDLVDTRAELEAIKTQTSCRSALNADVNDALNRVRNVDGSISVTTAQLFQEALTAPLTDERKVQIAGVLRDQIAKRDTLQAEVDVKIERQLQSNTLCPS